MAATISSIRVDTASIGTSCAEPRAEYRNALGYLWIHPIAANSFILTDAARQVTLRIRLSFLAPRQFENQAKIRSLENLMIRKAPAETEFLPPRGEHSCSDEWPVEC